MKHARHATGRERRLLRQLAGHFAMGATLGAGFALWLLAANTQRIAEVIAGCEAPITMRAILVMGLAVQFGFGAAVTAFLMLVVEDD
jgi:hypothetical protein